MAADLVLVNARFTTLDRGQPAPEAVAIRGGRFGAVGDAAPLLADAGPAARVIDLQGRRVVPGLIDSHMHFIRGGLRYNLELRWDGVPTLADAMALLRAQVAITPPPQWVRVVGGISLNQFAERRLPTLAELNAVAPETPVLILHLYERALLNRAALRAAGYTRETPDPPGGRIQRDRQGRPTGLLLARPNAQVLNAALARGPRLRADHRRNSARHFMRELNRLGVTGVIDAGGALQNYPEDYELIRRLDDDGELTLRIAYNLYSQRPGLEREDFEHWGAMVSPGDGSNLFRHNGAGERLVFSAADFTNFSQPRPRLPAEMSTQLEGVVRTLVRNRWPWRMHATYDETISQALDVFEGLAREQPFDGLHWFFDHAETISERNIERVAALGGGIAVQHRMAFQGEQFVARYGAQRAEQTPPLARLLAAGLPLGAGTDATRVASYNPWVSLAWLVSGRTVGGLRLYPPAGCLDRETALRLWTERNTWFSNDEGRKGRIQAGQLADLAVLSADYFGVPEDEIARIDSVLTLLGGKVVHGAGPFRELAPPLPPAMPDWSPVRRAS